MARLTPHFSSNRTVREYTTKYYLPAADSYRKRTENNSALAKKIIDWRASVEQNWGKLGFGEIKIEDKNDQHQFEVQVYLNNLDHQEVLVELYSAALKQEMKYQGPMPNTRDGHIYRAAVPAATPTSGFTPRIIPHFQGVAIPLESAQILWQR